MLVLVEKLRSKKWRILYFAPGSSPLPMAKILTLFLYLDIIASVWWRIRATCGKKKSCKGLKSYVGDNESYVGDNKYYVGDAKSYIGLNPT